MLLAAKHLKPFTFEHRPKLCGKSFTFEHRPKLCGKLSMEIARKRLFMLSQFYTTSPYSMKAK